MDRRANEHSELLNKRTYIITDYKGVTLLLFLNFVHTVYIWIL